MLLFIVVTITTLFFSKDYIIDEIIYFAQEEGVLVRQIYLEGRKYADLDVIKKAVKIEKGDAIIGIPVDEIREDLEKLKWVERAAVEIKFPDEVHVQIYERKPVAFFQSNNKLSMIDRVGHIMEAHPDFTDLPILIGASVPDRITGFWEILEENPEILGEISSATVISNRRWNIILKNGIIIKLPEENVAKSWKKLAEFYAKANLENIKGIDMRLDGKMYIQKKNKYQNVYKL